MYFVNQNRTHVHSLVSPAASTDDDVTATGRCRSKFNTTSRRQLDTSRVAMATGAGGRRTSTVTSIPSHMVSVYCKLSQCMQLAHSYHGQ